MHEEIGAPLTLADLRALLASQGSGVPIVVVGREDRSVAVTARLMSVSENMVHFAARPQPTLEINLLVFVHGEELRDDTGRRIFVHAYLGEP